MGEICDKRESRVVILPFRRMNSDRRDNANWKINNNLVAMTIVNAANDLR
jgi:hypothetical protein